MNVYIDPKSIADYRTFLQLSDFRHTHQRPYAWFPDEYAERIGLVSTSGPLTVASQRTPTH